MDVEALTIVDAARRLASGELSAVAMTRACLDRIEARRDLGAFITVLADAAMADAQDADRDLAAGRRRGALHGIPVSLKDVFDVRGVRTSAASRLRDDHVAHDDATVVARLRAAGAVLIGKCNLHELALGTTSAESAYGPVRNPFDPTRVAGGSSGGSAVAVRTGMSLASIGTDTGGSIRIPAAACGVVGLKPSWNEVPTSGILPLSRTLDHVGLMTKTVPDAAVVFHALTGRTAEVPSPADGVAGLRLGVPRAYFYDLLDDEVRARADEAIDRLRASGAHVADVDIDDAAESSRLYPRIMLAEAFAYHRPTLDARADRYGEALRAQLDAGRYLAEDDYVRARAGRERLRAAVDAALESAPCDALALPTLPIPAPPIGEATVDVGGSATAIDALMLRQTQAFGLSGHPAISLPCGFTANGLPCGLQLVGRRGATDRLLHVASACELLVAVAPASRIARAVGARHCS